MSVQRRRDVRYAIRFPAKLSLGKRSRSLVTSDVSYSGVFLRTDTPPPLQQLVNVELVLPVGDHALSVHGMTVRVVQPEDPSGYDAGIGVQFYAVDHTTRDSWEAFIRHVEDRYPRAADQAPLRMPRGFTPEPVRRRVERHTAVIKLEPAGARELEELGRAVQSGSLFAPTNLDLPAGTRVIVDVVHPSSGHPFLLEAVVVGGPDPARSPGVSLTLPEDDARSKEDFADFVRGGILIDDELVLPPD